MIKTVAFFGLGHMGGPMSANLVKAGFAVNGFDPVEELLDLATKNGVKKSASSLETIAGADFVLSMLPNGEDVEALYIDGEKLLDHIDRKTLVIDCSTIAATSSKRLIAEAQKRGLRAIEAPVSGGVAGAVAGTLSFMCGGEAADVKAARAVLQHMGSNVDNGLDPKVLSEIMLKSSGANWSPEKYNPYPGVMDGVPAGNNYRGGFMVKLMCRTWAWPSRPLQTARPIRRLVRWRASCTGCTYWRAMSSCIFPVSRN